MPDQDDASSTAAAIAMQQSEARLRLMIDAVPAMITYLDTEERYLFCNRPYLDLLGMPADRVLGQNLLQVLGTESHASLAPWRQQVLGGDTARYTRQHTRVDGSTRDLSVTFIPHLVGGRVVGFFSLTLDVTEVKALERKLAHMAGHDALTGLPNRTLYNDRLAGAIERHKRQRQPFALPFLDIDHLKDVNDTHGHAIGDQLLRGFAQRLRATLRSSDTCARLGGDEFALILDGPVDPEGAAALAHKLNAAARIPFDIGGLALCITTSIGISIVDDASESGVEAQADAALYRAKARGRDTFELSE